MEAVKTFVNTEGNVFASIHVDVNIVAPSKFLWGYSFLDTIFGVTNSVSGVGFELCDKHIAARYFYANVRDNS